MCIYCKLYTLNHINGPYSNGESNNALHLAGDLKEILVLLLFFFWFMFLINCVCARMGSNKRHST